MNSTFLHASSRDSPSFFFFFLKVVCDVTSAFLLLGPQDLTCLHTERGMRKTPLSTSDERLPGKEVPL